MPRWWAISELWIIPDTLVGYRTAGGSLSGILVACRIDPTCLTYGKVCETYVPIFTRSTLPTSQLSPGELWPPVIGLLLH